MMAKFCENLNKMGDPVKNRFIVACASTVLFFLATPPIYAVLWSAGLVMGAAALIGFIVCAIVAKSIYDDEQVKAEKLLGSCFPGALAAAPRCLTLSLSCSRVTVPISSITSHSLLAENERADGAGEGANEMAASVG